MKSALFLTSLLLGCSNSSIQDQTLRAQGPTGIVYEFPVGLTNGNLLVRADFGDAEPLTLAFLMQTQGIVEGGRLEMLQQLTFDTEEFSRIGSNVIVKRRAITRDLDFLVKGASGIAWSVRKPASSPPANPDPTLGSGGEADVYVGDRMILLDADVTLQPNRRVSGIFTFIPSQAVSHQTRTIDDSRIFTIRFAGDAHLACSKGVGFTTQRVNIEDPRCASLFAGFEGPFD